MKTRIAVYTKTKNFWGGSFQYAKAVTVALAGLDPEFYDIQVWHEDDEEWNALTLRLGFAEHILSQYDFPPEFLPIARKTLTLLQSGTLSETQSQDLQELLRPYSAETLLKEFRPHLLICPQMGGQFYMSGVKHLAVIHDLMHRYETRFPEVNTPGEVQARENLFRTMIARYSGILVDSKVGKRHVLECYSSATEEQLHILPFTAFSEVTSCEPRKPEFPLPEKFFFYPAQFWQHKNHAGLAQAVATLVTDLPDIHVVTAGNTDQNGYAPFLDVLRATDTERHFSLPGYITAEELAWCYQNAQALVMPTFFGPTNIPPLEAMALGCPVAVSGIYGMPEQCGDAALYFQPNDIPDMAGVLRRLWTDDELCEKMREKGKNRAKLYDVARFNKQTLRIVKSILGQQPESDAPQVAVISKASPVDLPVDGKQTGMESSLGSRSNSQPLRVMQVDDFYAGYLDAFYRTHPGLSLKSSTEQCEALFKDGFSASHAVVPYLPNCETEYFVSQAKPLQRSWAREQGIPFSGDSATWEADMIRLRVESFRPDVLYLADPIRFDADFLQSLPFKPRMILGWKAADIPMTANFSGYDVLLSNVPNILEAGKLLGAAHGEMLYPGAPEWIADHVAQLPQDVDVCFAGSLFAGQHRKRIAVFDAVARAAAEHGFSLALHLFGNPNVMTPAMRPYLRPPVFGLAMHEALRRGRIVLNMGGSVNMISPTGERKLDLGGDDVVNMRLFEATAGGSLLLTETMPGVKRYFDVGREVLFYQDTTHLIQQILYYLAHEEERAAIAEAGRRRCLDEHSMTNMAQRFLGIIEKHLPR